MVRVSLGLGSELGLGYSGVARGGAREAMAPPKLLVNVFFRNELMSLRGLNV